MLRVCGTATCDGSGAANSEIPGTVSGAASFFSVDSRKKQVTLFDPAACGGTAAPEDRRVGVAAPKMFAFDAIFTQDDSQTEMCSSALTDVIHAVINGTDGCLFCFGHARLGKTYTMVGSPDATSTLGVIPCAISWLFRGINEQKQKTGARFSVRVSAVEVQQQNGGSSQQLKDLLVGHANDCEQSPGVYLRDDPLFGTQLQNQSELRVPTAEKAAFYLDAAVNSRGDGDSHFLYTLHVYQYSVAGKGHGVAGGRSRLHLIDLGSCERGKANGGISLSGLGNVLLAIFNGQKHLPYREHKVTQMLKECLSSLTCHAAMIVHVSPAAQHYTDTLTTIQLASRIHRMRRRKIKIHQFGLGSAGSGGSSGEEAARLQAQENGRSTGSSDVDPSSSEQSADTVIYVGPSDDAATDGEHPPVYIPSLNSGDNRCAMGKALRGSGAEHRPSAKSKSASSSPAKSAGTQSKLTRDDSGSPSHRGISKTGSKSSSPSHNSSAKSSPVRTPSKTASHSKANQSAQSQSSSNIPVPFSTGGSDEQWIDGPRISKSRVAEARILLKDSHKKRETWIDGPLQTIKLPNLGNGPASGGYGFMDNHKKSMIRKWVENQTGQIQRQTPKSVSSNPTPPQRPSTTGASQTLVYKELTTFKTCDMDANTAPVEEDVKLSAEEEAAKMIREEPGLGMPDVVQDVKCNGSIKNLDQLDEMDCSVGNNEKNMVDTEEKRLAEKEGTLLQTEIENAEDDVPPPLQLFQPHNKEISLCDSLDVRLGMLEERREAAGAVGQIDIQEDDDEVEIIEVEETFESVPMQDSCVQVTEEDINLCMEELGNMMPDEEHPLRILSQENLTVVSTFTDSMSVATDLERMLPCQRYVQSESGFPNHRPYSLYKLPDEYITQPELRLFSDKTSENKQHSADLLSNQNKFEQLARLHEMYRDKLARVNVPKGLSSSFSPSLQYRPPSRCQSLSMSDMLYGTNNPGTGNGSIYSEPAYNPHRPAHQDQVKICDNCKMNFGHIRNGGSWYQPLLPASAREHLSSHHPIGTTVCDSVSHRYCMDPAFHTPRCEPVSPRWDRQRKQMSFHAQNIGSGCSVSSLRHPDGASNPDLKEEVDRVPGNGTSTCDHKENFSARSSKNPQVAREEVRTVTGKAHDDLEEEEDEPPPNLPPPLPPAPASIRLHQRLLSGKASPRHSSPRTQQPSMGPEGYDSGHDSSSPSPRPKKASQLVSCQPRMLVNRRAAALVSTGQCESSGYESVARDSECSSFGSSQDSDARDSHDPGSSKKVPVLQYCREDVERLERRWTGEQGCRIRELRAQQQELKQELLAAKTRLLIPSSRWSYELHVEESMDCRDPSFLEALDKETQILKKRVDACKSHILMVTCFDTVLKTTQV